MKIEPNFLEDLIKIYGKEDAERIVEAFNFSSEKHKGQKRDSGEDFIVHPYNVAKILVSMHADVESVIVGLIHDCPKCENCDDDEVEKKFGKEVSKIVDGCNKFGLIKQARMLNTDENENLRKMILSLNKDARVAFVKLADRLDNMQTLQYKSRDKQIKIASETLDLFVPIAERLGMNKFKRELDDLCFKYIYPDEYKEVNKFLEDNYKKCDKINKEIAQKLQELADKYKVKARIQSRVKSAFSIFKKQNTKGKNSIYDIIAHRIIVDEIQDCYTMLGAVHNTWKPVEGRIKDYIANPKKNLYMSLHTTMIYPTENGGIPFEVQIRTEEMHIFCEYGMAAHWMYKENGSKASKFDGNSAMLEIKTKLNASGKSMQEDEAEEALQIIKTGFYAGKIFVFTPQLKVIELDEGSNAIDFAYAVHTNLGNRCSGAKVNGKMVPLSTKLHTSDVVEILTSATSKGPSRDWLKICKNRGTFPKIRAFFKKERREENIKIGKDMIEEQLKRKGYSLSKFLDDKDILEELFVKHTLSSVDDIYAIVGYGGVTVSQIIGKFVTKQKQLDNIEKKTNHQIHHSKNFDGILVDGQGDMLKKVAKCCNPVPGDEIVGYVSRGKGVVIHRKNCPALEYLENERIIPASWNFESLKGAYVASFKVLAKDGASILNTISNKITDNKIDISYLNVERNKKGEAILDIGVLINSREELSDLINKISSMNEVYEVYR